MSALDEIAAAYGVATDYWDWRGGHVHIRPDALVAVLAAMGVDAATDASCRAALAERDLAPWRRVLPQYVVGRDDAETAITVHVRDGADAEVWVILEDGRYHAHLRQLENHTPPREVDGRRLGEASFAVPAGLPPGYHALHARTDDAEYTAPLIVAPSWLGLPAHTDDAKLWGLATQLYSVRSRWSWGLGDLADLADLATWAGSEHGADFVLVNPMHAAEPVAPIEPSPYLPVSRRFANPIYLRVERVPEYALLDPATRARVDAFAIGPESELIDRDAVWTAKRAALRIVHAAGREPGREIAYQGYRRREGAALADFATWCALTEVHGPDWRAWPAEVRHPRAAGVAGFAAGHAAEVDFHCWLQWVLDEQFAQTQLAARTAGMALGIVHDLAVGVSTIGADAWAGQDEYAVGVTVGAPPDAYAQTGQDWNQPPWRPDRLAELGFAPFRDLVRAALRHSGGLRVDHIIGLFRLWWIPGGFGPADGTYVRYDHEALVGILALEAARAGAVVVGEDLGTVEPWVRDHLRGRGLLGTSVLWFELDYDGGGGPRPPERWREYSLASVTTHDLPPTAGYLSGEHIRLRHDLGLLTRPLDVELEADRVERQAWLDFLRERGLLGNDPTPDEVIAALHRALTFAPARLRCLALTDAVSDRRAQNQPGANVGYPNWRVPLCGPDGVALYLEDVFTSTRAATLAGIMRGRPAGP